MLGAFGYLVWLVFAAVVLLSVCLRYGPGRAAMVAAFAAITAAFAAYLVAVNLWGGV